MNYIYNLVKYSADLFKRWIQYYIPTRQIQYRQIQYRQKKRVMVSCDIIIDVQGKILLIERGNPPYKGCWAFPGGKIDVDDPDIISAALRELKEETNIILNKNDLVCLKYVGNNERDPRGFTVSFVFYYKSDIIPKGIKAGDDAVNCVLFGRTDLPCRLAFDHKDILLDYFDKIYQ